MVREKIWKCYHYPISLEKQKHTKIFIQKNRFPKSNKLKNYVFFLCSTLSENDVLIVCNVKKIRWYFKKILIIAGENLGTCMAQYNSEAIKKSNYYFLCDGVK